MAYDGAPLSDGECPDGWASQLQYGECGDARAGALCGDLPGDGLQDDVESTSLPTRVTVDDPPTPRPPPPPPPPPRAGGEGMFRPFPAQGLPGGAQGQFYRPVQVELTVGGVPMVGYRQGIPGVDYSIELTMRKPDQPDQRPAAEPPIVGKTGTTATGPSPASAGASSASSRAPTTENPRDHATESQATAASASSASTTENRANAASAPSANPAYSRLGVVAERVMPDGRRVMRLRTSRWKRRPLRSGASNEGDEKRWKSWCRTTC